MLGYVVTSCVLLALFLFLTRHAKAPCDLIAVSGAECELFYSGRSTFFLQDLERPVLRAHFRICLIDGSSLQPLSVDEVGNSLTTEELATVSRYIFDRIWKGWRICVFRNCVHADKLKKRARYHREYAEHLRLHPEPHARPKLTDDDVFPFVF